MEINRDLCRKVFLPDGRIVDILTDVFEEIDKWIQNNETQPESGGYILGYQHEDTGNVTIEKVTPPFENDVRTRFHFKLCDKMHDNFLEREKINKSYYLGVWHTHPEDKPTPSSIDWEDWKTSLKTEKGGGAYLFFIIAGRKEIRIWAGSLESRLFEELTECKKECEMCVVEDNYGKL